MPFGRKRESVYILVTICLFPLNHVYTNKCAGVATETEVRFVPAAIYNFTTKETRYQPTTTDSRKTKTTTTADSRSRTTADFVLRRKI